MTTKQTQTNNDTRRTVKLSELAASPANPRTSMNIESLDELAASLLTDGVLQNLVVKKKGRKYEIISGGRRYAALCRLRDTGAIPADYAVPVCVRSGLDEHNALRIATVENIQRVALPPLDEAEAFARLAKDGTDLESIAAKAGVSETTVRRRFAIAGLSDAAKNALRAGDISLAVAEALTLGSAAEQQEALEQLQHGYYDAEDVRAWFTGDKPSVADAIFPLDMYEGTYTSDLFADEQSTYFDDPTQFMQLQRAAIEKRAGEYAEKDVSVEIINAAHVPWWQYDEAEDGKGTAVIHLGPTGKVEIREGLVKRELHTSVATAATTNPVSKPKPEYTGPVMRYMATRKTLAVQAALMKDERRAKQVAIVQLITSTRAASRIRLEPHPAHMQQDGAPENPLTSIAERCASLLSLSTGEDQYHRYVPAVDILTRSYPNPDPVALYERTKHLSESGLDELLLLLTTLCFGQDSIEEVETGDCLFNRVAADLEINMADQWRPDEAFLSKRTTAQLAEIARESGASEVIGDTKGWKKADLVSALVRYFERDDREGAKTWLPGGMRFDIIETSELSNDDDTQTLAEAAE